ncbi:MAG: DUF5666 domain-containing protein [Armatimonadetes bacterium]|nr:DUF5666 domain-containing protein [Armatimonadota bacterium]
MKRIAWITAAVGLFLLLLTGCGGGGSGSGGGSTGVSFFITDNLSTNFDHVYVTIHEVELEYAGGSTKVFESDAGTTVDLRALNNGSNLFSLLGVSSVPNNTFTGARVSVANTASIIATGQTNATQYPFLPSLVGGNGRARLNVTFPAPITLSTGSNIVLDFDLSQWTINGSGQIVPVVLLHNGSGVDDLNRQTDEDFKGTISALEGSAPTQAFTLNMPLGRTLRVSTTADTTVLNDNGAPNAVLANGQTVEVYGKFSLAAGRIVARLVKIEDGQGAGGDDKVKGPTRNGNAATGTLEIKAVDVRGFLPTNLWVNVTSNTNTAYFNDAGRSIPKAAFFEAIGLGAKAEAEGAYNDDTNTLLARKLKLEDFEGDDGAEIKGTASEKNAQAGTFRVTLTEWSGFNGAPGVVVPVETGPNTTYRNNDGATLTKTQFFEQLTNGGGVKVEGYIENGVMKAKKAQLRTNVGGGGGQAEAKGTASGANSTARTYTLRLSSWFGFNGSLNQDVAVTMTENATYRNDNGESITKNAFFELIANGAIVEVEGTYSNGAFTGVKAKIDDD